MINGFIKFRHFRDYNSEEYLFAETCVIQRNWVTKMAEILLMRQPYVCASDRTAAKIKINIQKGSMFLRHSASESF